MLSLAKNCDFRTCSSLFVDNLCESCSHCRHAPRCCWHCKQGCSTTEFCVPGREGVHLMQEPPPVM